LAENMLPHAKEKNASGLDFPAQQWPRAHFKVFQRMAQCREYSDSWVTGAKPGPESNRESLAQCQQMHPWHKLLKPRGTDAHNRIGVEKTPLDRIVKLIDSIPHCYLAVVEANDFATKYLVYSDRASKIPVKRFCVKPLQVLFLIVCLLRIYLQFLFIIMFCHLPVINLLVQQTFELNLSGKTLLHILTL
jgi:hypothetical protein